MKRNIKKLKTPSAAINDMDLEVIKVNLIDSNDGPGWSLSKADLVAEQYRFFLFQIFRFPQNPLAPSKDVDTFWHYHILDTRKYQLDCDRIFDRYIHHDPYMGMRDQCDYEKLQSTFASGINLAEELYQEIELVAEEVDIPRPPSHSARHLSGDMI